MKKAYLIHGWGGNNSSEVWFGWLKEQLKNEKIEVIAFNMPNTENPKIEEWIPFLQKNIKDIDQETYFIGHSIGCQAVLRYLETLEPSIKVRGCIFVAPWMELDKNTIEEEGEEVIQIAKPWMETPIDFNKIKKHTKNFLAIFSDNDPYVPLTEIDRFKKELDSKIILKKDEEHFNKTKEIKEIIEFIK
jgi:uncharacterized protein